MRSFILIIKLELIEYWWSNLKLLIQTNTILNLIGMLHGNMIDQIMGKLTSMINFTMTTRKDRKRGNKRCKNWFKRNREWESARLLKTLKNTWNSMICPRVIKSCRRRKRRSCWKRRGVRSNLLLILNLIISQWHFINARKNLCNVRTAIEKNKRTN